MRIIVDRDQMAAEFLATLHVAGRTVITVLRTDQYRELESFTEIGGFVPFRVSTSEKVVRVVAPASIALPLPNHSGESLHLRVALIRDLCRHIPLVLSKEEVKYPKRWDADLNWHEPMRWDESWKATPTPAISTTPKLFPIVTTASTVYAVELTQTYTQRWSAQENIIRDFLLPLGLEIVCERSKASHHLIGRCTNSTIGRIR